MKEDNIEIDDSDIEEQEYYDDNIEPERNWDIIDEDYEPEITDKGTLAL